ncbi:methyltransferase [Atlantibacter sp.]|uniref:methyltransferase n=1 Tax=Atlantibacter sp. TaxID=1903473 RepID=UPI0028A9B810|nr:methyltransferase [Atlantibacter sp.]
MSNLFDAKKYVFDDESGVYKNPNYQSIKYSDGDQIEENIYSIITSVKDVSVLSDELKKHCTDWPTIYHLGSQRSNILRPFAKKLSNVDVLEIGAGCGAITRYLGECGANVLALEGSIRRARIARSRTRDLNNITLLAEKFSDFQTESKFDVITLIGVLEYANLFTDSVNPAKTMLETIRQMLKPDGILIIAIENQLGLKYFAGSPEDHVWRIMYGIEGRYTKTDPETFGKDAITRLIKSAGFSSQKFFAPFPDYKTPNSIVCESAYDVAGFNASAFASENALKDYQLPNYLFFSQEKAWKVIHDNNLAMDLSNSFLIVAGPDSIVDSVIDQEAIAFHYSTARSRRFCKQSIFNTNDNNSIEVITERMVPNGQQIEQVDNLINQISPITSYISGQSLNDRISEIVSKDYWQLDDFISILKDYIVYIIKLHSFNEYEYSPEFLKNEVDGALIDCIPQNIICDNKSGWQLIDQEWKYIGNISLKWLLFRVLLITIQSNTRFGYNEHVNDLNRHQFVKLCFNALEYNISDEELDTLGIFEADLQSQVTSIDKEKLQSWYSTQLIKTRPLIEDVMQLKNNHANLLHENDTFKHELDSLKLEIDTLKEELEDRHLFIAGLTNNLNDKCTSFDDLSLEKEEQQSGIYALYNEIEHLRLNEQLLKASLSWKVTSPLRSVRTAIKKVKSYASNKLYSSPNSKLNYVIIRGYKGVRRHGVIKSVPLSVKTAWTLSNNYLRKVNKNKLYARRIDEIEQLIKNEKNFIDLFHVPMGWNTPLFQRFQHLSLQSAQLGGLALYGGHIQVDKDLFVYDKTKDDVYVFDALDAIINQRIKEALNANKAAVKVVRVQSIDMATSIDELIKFQEIGCKVVYEYIDEISEEIIGTFPEFVVERHKWILSNESIYVVATATKLYEEVATYRNTNMLLSTNGVDIGHWHTTPKSVPSDLANIITKGKTIIGYHGALAKWIDYELLNKIAANDNYILLLIGYEHDSSMRESGLLERENVYFLGSKSYFELPQYAYYYDIGILPFKKYKLTESVSPVKLFEYMALGKPIVTTDLVECLKYESCLIAEAEDHEAFVANLAKAVTLKSNAEYQLTLQNEAVENSWQSKTVDYLQLVGIHVNNVVNKG